MGTLLRLASHLLTAALTDAERMLLMCHIKNDKNNDLALEYRDSKFIGKCIALPDISSIGINR